MNPLQYLLCGPDTLVDAWGRAITVEGKLKLPDVPKTEDDATINGTLACKRQFTKELSSL